MIISPVCPLLVPPEFLTLEETGPMVMPPIPLSLSLLVCMCPLPLSLPLSLPTIMPLPLSEVMCPLLRSDLSEGGAVDSPSGETFSLFHLGAGTIKLEIASSLIALSLGGGGHTKDSIMSSVV